MVAVEVANRSGVEVEQEEAVELARRVLAEEGIDEGELGLHFVGPDEMRALKRDHLGIDEVTDVLSFPIDAREPLEPGLPRQLGDAILCPQVVGEALAAAARPRAPSSRRLRPRRRDGNAGGTMERLTHRRARTLLESFNFAVEGIIHVLRTQRNMRIHFLAAVVVLVTAIAIGVNKLELIALLLAIAFVFITEMINSALEQAIDVSTTSFDPLAKMAKDIAAGAVLIATLNAIAVGYLVFSGEIADRSGRLLDRLRDAPAQLTLIALVVTVILVIAAKAYTGRGRPLSGGLPSGHAAVAFAGWMAATLIIGDSHRFLISTLTFIMAMLVAQTRVESGIHSALEVTYGGVLGALVTLAVFQLFA